MMTVLSVCRCVQRLVCGSDSPCVQAETFESDLARRLRMSSWLRPPYGISMRKNEQPVSLYSLSELNQKWSDVKESMLKSF